MRSDPLLPPVFTVQQAMKVGLSPKQIEGRIHTGHWHRLRRGTFTLASRWEQSTPEQRHLLLVTAISLCRAGGTPFVFSHMTAATLLGLPVPRRMLDRAALTVDPAHGCQQRRERDLCQHVARLRPEDVTLVRGLPVTAPARTIADCLRHLDPFDSVPVADAAIRAGLCTTDQVVQALATQSGWPYSSVAAAALLLVDPRRESPLESRSAVVMHRHDIPAPVPQVKIVDARGVVVARVDFAWLERSVVGEADGRVKYTDADPVDTFEAEKERQARLEALGLVVVRWNSRHLIGDPPPLVERLRQALDAGHSSRFTGRAA